jgi:hypothetical protein
MLKRCSKDAHVCLRRDIKRGHERAARALEDKY